MIVDAHVHTSWGDPDQRPDRILQLMDEAGRRNGIGKQVMMGSAGFSRGPWPESQVRDCNSGTLLAMKEFPDMAVGCCFLNPANSVTFMREETERCIVEGKMAGIKLHVHVNARDARLDPIMERARELKVPVVYHAWYKTVEVRGNESTPADIADLARRHPDVDIMMAHLGGCGARGVQDIKELPNVHVDTSGGQPESMIVEYAVKHLGPERVLYGSDFPGRDYATQLSKVFGANISRRAQHMILTENAVRLFGIGGVA